jgi:hypothetical protein
VSSRGLSKICRTPPVDMTITDTRARGEWIRQQVGVRRMAFVDEHIAAVGRW